MPDLQKEGHQIIFNKIIKFFHEALIRRSGLQIDCQFRYNTANEPHQDLKCLFYTCLSGCYYWP